MASVLHVQTFMAQNPEDFTVNGWDSYWKKHLLKGILPRKAACQIFDAIVERVKRIEGREYSYEYGRLKASTFIRPEAGMLLAAPKPWFGPYGGINDFFSAFKCLLNTPALSFESGGRGVASAFMLRQKPGEINEWISGNDLEDFIDSSMTTEDIMSVTEKFLRFYEGLNNMRYIVSDDLSAIIDGDFCFQD